jgi:hypothetical protein
MSYEVKFKLNLDQYSPLDIIEWHKQGILTMDEIIESGRMNTTFGDDLRNYVYEWTSMRKARELYAMEVTRSSETRMITNVDRKIRSAG